MHLGFVGVGFDWCYCLIEDYRANLYLNILYFAKPLQNNKTKSRKALNYHSNYNLLLKRGNPVRLIFNCHFIIYHSF